jgi:proline iminopeptidase
VQSTGVGGDSPAEYARAFARLENHYFTHRGFLDHDGHILARMGDLRDVPGTIVQGRYDMICPPITAHRIAEAWPKSDLRIIPVAGHALSEPGISADLVGVMQKVAQRY